MWATPLLLAPLLGLAADEYKYVSLIDGDSSYTDDQGNSIPIGSHTASRNAIYSSPTVVTGTSTGGYFFEWTNYATAGRQFSHFVLQNLAKFVFIAAGPTATVTVRVPDIGVSTYTVNASVAVEATGSWQHKIVEIESTEDVVASAAVVDAANTDSIVLFLPLVPVSRTIFGQCSPRCFIQVWGGGNLQVEQTCADGTTATESVGGLLTASRNYVGPSCMWTAPEGSKIGGMMYGASGFEAVSLLPAEYFHLTTPVPIYLHFLLLISEGPALCSWTGGEERLIGSNGIYEARLAPVQQGTVVQCDLPVMALGDRSTVTNQIKEMSLIVAPLPTTTTMSTTTSTRSTTTTTTATITATTATATATTATATTATATTATATTATTTTTASSLTSSTTGTISATTTSSSMTSGMTSRTTTSATTTSALMSGTTSTTTTSATTTSTLMSETTFTTTTSTTTSLGTTTCTGTTSTATSTTPTSTTTAPTTLTSATTVSSTTTSTATMTTTLTTTSPTTSTSSAAGTTANSTTTTSTMSMTTSSTTGASRSLSSTTSITTSSTTSSNTATNTWTTLSLTNTTATATYATSTMPTTTATTHAFTAVALVDRVESVESSLLEALVGNNLTTVTQRVEGLTLVAVRLDPAAVSAHGVNLTVGLEDGEVVVALPASLNSSLGLNAQGFVLTVAGVDDMSSWSESGEQVARVVNVNLLSFPGGRHLSVDGLVDPIRVVIPVNSSEGLQCAFWDEAKSSWATEGMELGTVGEGFMECKTWHLTLFAAIFRGLQMTFACAQVSLLSAESIRELGRGKWYKTLGARSVWVVLATFTVLMSLAACLDCRRSMQGRSNDEHFLIPCEGHRQDPQQEEEPQEQRGFCACAVASTLCLVACLCDWCRDSGALREVIDEIFSQWAEYFGEIRDLVESLTAGLALCGEGGLTGCGTTLVHRLMSVTLVLSARRQAAASCGVSSDASSLIMDDKEMFDLLLSHSTRKRRLPDPDQPPNALDLEDSVEVTVLAREATWGNLQRELEAELDKFMEAAAHLSSIPGTVWWLFLHHNPIWVCLVHCPFMSAKLRVVFFMVDVMGGLLMTTVFFAATGVPQKRGRPADCTFDNPFEFIGRLVAIATGSVLVSGIPAIILGSLSTRGIKRFDFEGCPQWNRQLKVWRIQDRAIWVLALLYLAFCVFFVSLFLANVGEEDHEDWITSNFISVVEAIVLIPLCLALALPLLATVSLHFMSFHRRAKKEELIEERHTQFKRECHMTMPLGSV